MILSNKELESQKALKNEQTEVRKEHTVKMSNERRKMEADKEAIRKKLGGELFDDVYSFLIHHRSMDKTDEGQLFEDLKDMV